MHDDTPLHFDVVEVISGDLLRGEHPSGGNATIRVYGIDAPEKDHPLGPFAIELAREVTAGVTAAQQKLLRCHQSYYSSAGTVITSGQHSRRHWRAA